MTDEALWAARKTRAGLWVRSSERRNYPALAAEDETKETLVAEPPKKDERKTKSERFA